MNSNNVSDKKEEKDIDLSLQKALRKNISATSIERSDIATEVASIDATKESITDVHFEQNAQSTSGVDTFHVREDVGMSAGSKIALTVIGIFIIITLWFVILSFM